MSLNAIQRRHPWIMAPFQWLAYVISPDWWACQLGHLLGRPVEGPARAAHALQRLLVVDTTGFARFLNRLNVLIPIRDVLLRAVPPLRWIDWQVRKLFWTMFWCGIVFTQGWPRRAPIPERERRIDLLSAPETYADFQSPTLVVPERVPCAETSMGAAMTVQFTHLVQDLYPVVSTHQPEAHADPQTRFERAYTFLYRLTRDAPRWHPQLADAQRRGELLARLAVGGPFAKLLQRAPARSAGGGDAYVFDLEHLRNYPVRDGLVHLGSRTHFTAVGSQLAVDAIEYDGERIPAGHPRWEFYERIVLAGLATHLTVWRQGMEHHVGGLAAVPVIIHNELPHDHPVRRLLAPHMAQTITTSVHTHVTLRRSGFDVTGFTFPYDVILRYYNDGAAAFDITRLDVALDAQNRGIAQTLDYPYLPQALRLYGIFEKYVADYLAIYYKSEEAPAGDVHVRGWYEALDAQLVRGIKHYAPALTRQNLTRLCTLLMYNAAVGHTENSLQDYAVFMPTTVRRDGKQQSVGQVQNVVNFQLLIATPTSLLLNDISHLALDGEAASVMRRFTQSLLSLQRELESQPSHYWFVFPATLEAGVSC